MMTDRPASHDRVDAAAWGPGNRDRRVKQHPEYLRNKRRYLEALLRRTRRRLRWFLILWVAGFATLFLASTLDVLAGLGWGFTASDVCYSGLFILFAGVFWLFSTLIMKIVAAHARHEDSADEAESQP
jgi:hypothetical protein